MPDFTLVDRWLDRWEELRESGQAPPLDQFIARHCQGSAPELIARFREQVHALESMDVKLQAAGTRSGDSSSEQTASPERTGAETHPGYEPTPGHVLECRLGKGGFGEVWKARAPGGFHVALKFVRLERRVRAAELRALETIKEIRHPHLLSVFGAYQQDGRLIIAMEMAERTLEQRFREACAQGLPGIPRDELLEYMAEAAKGLDYLNEPRHPSGDGTPRGIQHRDIKPQNLLLSGGSVKVGDFGLARCLEHSLVSHTGSLTAAYAAPEFFKGQTTSHSDQYSLAVTYCHLRGRRLPFSGNAAELMAGHLNREPDLSMLPPEERPAVVRALAKEAKDRWPSCGEFVKALRQTRPAQTEVMGASTSPARPTLLVQRRRRWLIGAVVALVVVAIGLAIWFRPSQQKGIPGKNNTSPTAPATTVGLTETTPASAQRGFGDTVLKYADRSYEKAVWKKIQEADSLGLRANRGNRIRLPITLHGVIGWDDDSFWVTGCSDNMKALAFHCSNGNWSLQADLDNNSVFTIWQRLLDPKTLLLVTGDRLYEVSPKGAVELDQVPVHANRDWGEICPVSPDLIFHFTSNNHPVSRVVLDKQTGLGQNESEKKFVHHDENILIPDRPIGGIKLTRTITAGKVIGIHAGPGYLDREPMIVSYRNGIWYKVTDLPPVSVQDVWVQSEGGSPLFVVALNKEGNLSIQHFGGRRYELSLPKPESSTSRKPLKVWGVSSEKLWVMDRSGTVWERTGTEWRVVVQGLSSGIAFSDAWVSPSGTVIAINRGEVYQLK